MNEKITIQDIANSLKEKQGLTKKDAELFVKSMFDIMKEALASDKYVKVKGLGTFKLTEVESRESINVNTGERFEIQGHTKISFTPDTTLKEQINKPFSHFETVILNDGVDFEDIPTENLEPQTQPEETEVATKEQEVVELVEIVQPEETTIETPSTPDVEPTEEPKEENIEETVEEIIEEPVIEKLVIEEPATKEPVVEQETTQENEPEETLPIEEPVQAEETPAIPEETVVATETSTQEQAKPTEEKKTSAVLMGIIVFLLLVILFGAYWLFFKPETATQTIPSVPVQQETTTAVQTSPEANQPSEEPSLEPKQEEAASPATEPKITAIEPLATPVKNERVPSLADTLEYKIIGTKSLYTLQSGETIIKASVKFFGSKKYWPYIAIYNRDVIKNVDNVPVGTQIKIPELTLKN